MPVLTMKAVWILPPEYPSIEAQNHLISFVTIPVFAHPQKLQLHPEKQSKYLILHPQKLHFSRP